jgi:hypothetical protein
MVIDVKLNDNYSVDIPRSDFKKYDNVSNCLFKIKSGKQECKGSFLSSLSCFGAMVFSSLSGHVLNNVPNNPTDLEKWCYVGAVVFGVATLSGLIAGFSSMHNVHLKKKKYLDLEKDGSVSVYQRLEDIAKNYTA